MTEMATYWRGTKLQDLSKEELISVVEDLADEVQKLRRENAVRSVNHVRQVAEMANGFRV